MKKKDIIKDIIKESDIWHNISINYSRLPEAEDEEYDMFSIAEYMLEDFKNEFEALPESDSGNRNLCKCKRVYFKEEDFKKDNGYNGRVYSDFLGKWTDYEEAKKKNLINRRAPGILESGACLKHDIYQVWQAGRSGATLYWEKYWNSTNRGVYFSYSEEELEELSSGELKTILKEIIFFKKSIEELMGRFYDECKYQLEERRAEKKEEEEKEEKYQNIKKQVQEQGIIKRLISELI